MNMYIKLNKEQLKDKIHACWLGKNIGGTLGGPYEGKREMLDIKGFASEPGEPLPNDDLDLQLAWLMAMEEVGPQTLDANSLGYYWLRYVNGPWNEYGIGKANMRMGILPPMSGELNNDYWKHSNGAWIRSEIWASLAPGFPQVAIRYALMDACIDHGIGEGTVAEMFTAALESLAYYETDVRTVVEKALKYIPENSRVAKDVRTVLAEYDKKTPYRDVRNMIVEQDKDLGWFMAPANIAFTVIGLIYGEGDFKNSLIYAVNCGDDTDCTAATCGAILGILKGTKGIPDDMKEYIGDRIITVSLDAAGFSKLLPKSCNELTDRVMDLIPDVLHANGVFCEYTDGETEIDLEQALKTPERRGGSYDKAAGVYDKTFIERKPYTFDINAHFLRATVSYDDKPILKPLESLSFDLVLTNLSQKDPHVEEIRLSLPEGWSADYPQTAFMHAISGRTSPVTKLRITITAGERVCPVNHATLTITSPSRPMPVNVPLVILG